MHYTYDIHDHCLPRSGAYHEIFLMQGDEMAEKTQIMGSTPVEEEPLYGLTYLPRKFKASQGMFYSYFFEDVSVISMQNMLFMSSKCI